MLEILAMELPCKIEHADGMESTRRAREREKEMAPSSRGHRTESRTKNSQRLFILVQYSCCGPSINTVQRSNVIL